MNKVVHITSNLVLMVLLNISVIIPFAEAVPTEQEFNGITFVKIDDGEFIFGSRDNSAYWQSTERQRPISLGQTFWISKFEVSQGEWEEVMRFGVRNFVTFNF